MTRCKSVYVTVAGNVIRCTRDEGHPVSEINDGPMGEMHRNFTPGHKIKWPENASSQMAGASPRIVIVDEVVFGESTTSPDKAVGIAARILGIGSPDGPTVDFHSIWKDPETPVKLVTNRPCAICGELITVGSHVCAPMSPVADTLTPPTVPEGLCGALSRNTEACVLTPHPEGTPHSWQK